MKRICRNCTKYNNCFHAFTNDQICKRGHVMKGNTMKFKVGDKLKVADYSWSFGIRNGQCSYGAPHKKVLTVTHIDLHVMHDSREPSSGEFNSVCDLLVVDPDGHYWFVVSRLCEPVIVDKKIELRYFCDGQDVTNDISDETKRNLTRN